LLRLKSTSKEVPVNIYIYRYFFTSYTEVFLGFANKHLGNRLTPDTFQYLYDLVAGESKLLQQICYYLFYKDGNIDERIILETPPLEQGNIITQLRLFQSVEASHQPATIEFNNHTEDLIDIIPPYPIGPQ
jgi:hypothetical protein